MNHESLTSKESFTESLETPCVSAVTKDFPPLKDSTALEDLGCVLSQDQVDVLKQIKDNLLLHYQTDQVFRSEVEMKFSVLNDGKFPTPDAKYWQAVREQQVHFGNLAFLSYEYKADVIKEKNLNDKIRKFQVQQAKIVQQIEDAAKLNLTDLDVMELQVDKDLLQNKIDTTRVELEKLGFIQADRKRTAYNRWREVVTWEKLMIELQPHMQYGILSYEHHQPNSYAKRMENQYSTMLKSGAKGSPSEAINITNQHTMIQKLITQGLLKPGEELPINKAVREVLQAVEADNYVHQNLLTEQQKSKCLTEARSQELPYVNKNLDEIFAKKANTEEMHIPNPQVPRQ